jgi:predicted DNA-binding transcriptional regulator AlpA
MNIPERSERGNAATSKLETLLNERDVARVTGLSLASVRRWRLLRQGPKYLKINSAVRYRSEDITAWLDSRPTGGDQHQSEAK